MLAPRRDGPELGLVAAAKQESKTHLDRLALKKLFWLEAQFSELF